MAEKPNPTSDLLAAIGGSSACRALSNAFYARVANDPALRPLFPGKTLKCATEEFAAFLVQFLGGPTEDSQRRWWLSLHESHLRFKIGPRERDAWLQTMASALRDVEMDEHTRDAFHLYFAISSAYVVNSGQPVPATDVGPTHPQIARRWDQQRALDEAVAAVREGSLDKIIALVENDLLHSCFQRDRSIYANFVGELIGSRNTLLTEYAHRTLVDNPDLAHKAYSGRTLLHAASAAGNLEIVELLLKLGVAANIGDAGGHTPLYYVGNECSSGGALVKALIEGGAKVDACEGAKRCTALHMAARRGNIEAAEALLDCGASVEARDSLGDTPLRRAVNCGRTRVAALLLARGADPHSLGSKKLTPLSATRSVPMRNLLLASVGGHTDIG